MSDVGKELVDDWRAARQALANPTFRRDVCFICEDAPRQVNLPGSPVGVCRACDEAPIDAFDQIEEGDRGE